MPELGPQLDLSFGGERVEFAFAGPPDEWDLAAVVAKAEAAFGLEPRTFSFHDQRGKIDTDAALRRAVCTAGRSGVACALEVREHPEWAKMRQLESHMQAFCAFAPAVYAAMQELELRMQNQVDAAIADVKDGLRHTDAKVSCVLAPLVEDMAMKQIDINEKLAADPVQASSLDAIGGAGVSKQAIKELEANFSKLAERADAAAAAESALRQELRVALECAQTARDEVKKLQAETRHAEPPRRHHALDLDIKNASTESDIQWHPPNSPGSRFFAGFFHSGKALGSPRGFKGFDKGTGVMGPAQFAKSNMPRHLDRVAMGSSSTPDLARGGRFLPQLPPMH